MIRPKTSALRAESPSPSAAPIASAPPRSNSQAAHPVRKVHAATKRTLVVWHALLGLMARWEEGITVLAMPVGSAVDWVAIALRERMPAGRYTVVTSVTTGRQ